MGSWKLWFVLLLPLIFYIQGQETQHLKILGKKLDAIPICNNDTQNVIMLIVCKIRIGKNWEEECRLLYRYGQDFVRECDSRFALRTENQTVFLRLTNLTPEDSGNYSCECSLADGTYIHHLNITVEEDENASGSSEIPFPNVVIGVIIFTIITGAILGLIHRENRYGRQPEPMTSHLNTELGDIEPYSTFIQRENGLYSVAIIR